MWWPRSHRASGGPEVRQTVIGTLAKVGSGQWEGFCELGGAEIRASADDVRGEPDPRLLAFLSGHWGELPGLAALARGALARISDEHHFATVYGPHEGGEVCLGFAREVGDWGETIFIEFEGGRIVTWSRAD
jgi:hypothetical protein